MHQDVGIVGLGAMGSRFARRLLHAGFRVHAVNRTPGRAGDLDELGLIREETPHAVAASADVVLVMLWDSESVSDAIRGENGILAGMRSGAVIVDLSTISPVVSAELAHDVAGHGGVMLDGPVSGSLDKADTGEVLVMAGGPRGALDRAMPVLDVIAARVIHVGQAHGSGLALKLAINAQVAVQLVGWGESLAITDAFGVDRRLATEIMLESVVASPMLRFRAPFTLTAPDVVWASVDLLRKDLNYARAAGAADATAVSHALRLLDRIAGAGGGALEAAALIEAAAGDRASAS